jgi:hypothetical protein
VDQVPVVPECKDCLLLGGDLHLAKSHRSSKVLLVKGVQTGGVQVLLKDSVFLAEMHGVDLVTVHEVNYGELSGQVLHTRRECEDWVGLPGK